MCRLSESVALARVHNVFDRHLVIEQRLVDFRVVINVQGANLKEARGSDVLQPESWRMAVVVLRRLPRRSAEIGMENLPRRVGLAVISNPIGCRRSDRCRLEADWSGLLWMPLSSRRSSTP